MNKPKIDNSAKGEQSQAGSFIGGLAGDGATERVGGAPPWSWDAQAVCVMDAATVIVSLELFAPMDGVKPVRKLVIQGETLHGPARIVAGGHLMWSLCRAAKVDKREVEDTASLPGCAFDPSTGEQIDGWEELLSVRVRDAITHQTGALIVEHTGMGQARSKGESDPRQFALARHPGPWRELAQQAAQYARRTSLDD